MRTITSLALLWAPLCRAFYDITNEFPRGPPPPSSHIAIIGAGVGGSSAAFWIAKAKERYGLDVVVDIFERNNYVGGRSTTVHPYNNTAYSPVELGASTFIEFNKNLWRAANEFNLSVDSTGSQNLAVWDGEEIVYYPTVSNTSAGNLKAQQGHGNDSLTIMHDLQGVVVDEIVTLYEPDTLHWSSIEELDDALNFTKLVSQTGAGVKASLIDRIHVLEALVSLVAESGHTMSVQGGNWQIFEQFVNRSGAKLFLKTEVISIDRCLNDTWAIVTKEGRRDYDAVVIATPYHTSHISLPANLSSLIPPQPYIHLHVTLLTTTAATPNPVYFGEEPGSEIPTFVMTTFENARHGGGAPEFSSLQYGGKALSATNGTRGQETEEWVVKIISMERISDEWLANMFQNRVSWVFRKEWNAYPVFSPTTKFPPIKLDNGLYYVNAFEPFISTMETETLSSRICYCGRSSTRASALLTRKKW